MKPIYIFRHIECEGPGYLGLYLQRRNIPFTVIRIDQGETIPSDPTGCSALAFMGGPMSVNDNLPWIEQELELIRRAASKKMPILGHCFGGQLISKALDGHVTANPVAEIGWLEVRQKPGATADNWLSELPSTFTTFHWHGETFSIPAGADNILTSDACTHQAFALDNILALQCHVEMNAEMVRQWAENYADEISKSSATVQSRDLLLHDIDNRITALQQVAERLYNRWLQPITADCQPR